ncbi:MAG: zf-HC2 domain-containing protein [Deltaproteobacteria bacterium]|nr:zf-HC2 domain-containing protein [Deltaproteobacteria bacterium]MBI3386266.1 zf-HC2 domain-containing protein [Deltaproteobacteria bacterium]
MSIFGNVRCAAVRRDLIAWIDGALGARHARRIAHHLETCAACAAEAESVRVSVRAQATALRATVAAESVDLDQLWRRLGPRLVDVEPDSIGWRAALRPLLRPALAIGVAAIALLVGVSSIDGPDTVLITVGVKTPPAALQTKPELFKDYAIIQQLDVLERFDTADVEPIMDAVTPAENEG